MMRCRLDRLSFGKRAARPREHKFGGKRSMRDNVSVMRERERGPFVLRFSLATAWLSPRRLSLTYRSSLSFNREWIMNLSLYIRWFLGQSGQQLEFSNIFLFYQIQSSLSSSWLMTRGPLSKTIFIHFRTFLSKMNAFFIFFIYIRRPLHFNILFLYIQSHQSNSLYMT